jgi:hypothetical protein
MVAQALRGHGVGVIVVALFFANAACTAVHGQSVFGQTTLSVFRKEMEDAEVLFFKGDTTRALARLKQAREAAKKEKKESDPLVRDALVDIVEAEVLALQGYLGAATSRLISARDDLQKRGLFYASRGADALYLEPINFRIGLCDILRGDFVFVQSYIDDVLQGDALAVRKCREHYESGLGIIRETFKTTDFREYEVQRRLLNRAEFRFARLLIIDGDLDRATSYFQDAEQTMKDDFVWIIEFVPIGRAGASLQQARERRPQTAGQSGGGNAPDAAQSAEKELERRAKRSGKSKDGGSAGDEPLEPEERLRSSYYEREAMRCALVYLECLAVKTELNLAKAVNEPLTLERAEEAASLARDIAEEKCPGTYHVDRTQLQLAKVYCERHKQSLSVSKVRTDDTVEVEGKTTNVHANAAKTYLDDAKELVEIAGDKVGKLNLANPLHVYLLDVQKRIASLSDDPSEVDRVQRAIVRYAKDRGADKPPKTR